MSIVKDMNKYKLAINLFQEAKGRMPGDIKNNGGLVGAWGDYHAKGSNGLYKTTDFKSPYNTIIPVDYVAPFIDLYLEGFIREQPKNVNTAGNNGIVVAGLPNFYPLFFNCPTFSSGDVCEAYASNKKITLSVFSTKYSQKDYNLLQRYDMKIDDGICNKGDAQGFDLVCNNTENYYKPSDLKYIDYRGVVMFSIEQIY
jgi:hypothetical protein